MDYIRNVISLVRSKFWLLPGLIMIASAGLAWWLLTDGDVIGPDTEATRWWLYSGEAATARDLLSSLLGGLMTMTSLVVSITFVILTLAASQLGPRLIAIFMRDRQIQGVLGLFIGTILYIVLIMRSLDDTLGREGVPHLAITTGTVLSILCLLALVFYLHKIARLIVADNVVTAVSHELRQTFIAILPLLRDQDDSDEGAWRAETDQPAWSLSLGKSGYVQVVNYQDLQALAQKHGSVLEVMVRAGHHVLEGGEHVIVRSESEPSEAIKTKIRAAFTVGQSGTSAQDPEHGIRQLVEIATRALSPGINDPFTAIAVIDQLGSSLEIAFARGHQTRIFRDEDGGVRVVADRTDDEGLLATAFNSIRQAGGGYPAIMIHLAGIIQKLAPAVRTTRQHRGLLEQLERLSETAALSAMTNRDGADVQAKIKNAWQAVIAASRPSLSED